MSGGVQLRVTHAGRDRFDIDIRGHRITADQPVDAGGEDSAPTPTELFVAGLASCIAFYARRYLDRHGIDPAGLEVAAQFDIGGRPARVSDIAVRITPPAALPPERLPAFLAVASGCTVHRTLQRPPVTTIVVDARPPDRTAAAVPTGDRRR